MRQTVGSKLARTIAVSALCLLDATVPSSAQNVTVARGQTIVELYCARCHATGPTGDSANKAAPQFRLLSQKYPIKTLAEAFAEGIVTGHPDMPEFQFLPKEIDEILAYLQSLQAPVVK